MGYSSDSKSTFFREGKAVGNGDDRKEDEMLAENPAGALAATSGGGVEPEKLGSHAEERGQDEGGIGVEDEERKEAGALDDDEVDGVAGKDIGSE